MHSRFFARFKNPLQPVLAVPMLATLLVLAAFAAPVCHLLILAAALFSSAAVAVLAAFAAGYARFLRGEFMRRALLVRGLATFAASCACFLRGEFMRRAFFM
jgi:hypothetical protein